MNSLTNYALKTKYEQVKKLRSRLEDMNNLVNWKKFLPYLPKKESNISDIEESEVLIDSDFLKLNLELGNFLVPNEIGDEDLVLKYI